MNPRNKERFARIDKSLADGAREYRKKVKTRDSEIHAVDDCPACLEGCVPGTLMHVFRMEDEPSPKRRGPPKGHPPYRNKVQTEKIHLSLTPELKARIEQASVDVGLTVNEWLRRSAERTLQADRE